MKHSRALLTLGLAFAASLSIHSAAAVDQSTGWHDKTVLLTARPRSGFVAVTAGKSPFAAIGLVAMERAGKAIAADNQIEDPAPQLGERLLKAAEVHYGVVPAPSTPPSVETTDVKQLARLASGADLLFDVQNIRQSFRYLSLDWSHYAVESSFKLRIVDVRAARLVTEDYCFQSTQDEEVHPTKEDLLENKAALLKQILDSERDACFKQFDAKVMSVQSE